MNFGTDGGVSKRPKVFYDEYTHGFYTESPMEGLKRKCEFRAKGADVLNKSEETRLNMALKSVRAARHLFEMKTEKEQTFHYEKLKDHLAYKHVLGSISKQRESDPDWDDKYGKYGPGISRADLEPQIQQQRHEMTPVVMRKRQAEHLLSNRKMVEVFDRKMKTPELLGLIRNKKIKPASPANKRKTPPKKENPKLILPPITVSWSKDSAGKRTTMAKSTEVSENNVEERESNSVNKNAENKGLPAVFVTQFDQT